MFGQIVLMLRSYYRGFRTLTMVAMAYITLSLDHLDFCKIKQSLIKNR